MHRIEAGEGRVLLCTVSMGVHLTVLYRVCIYCIQNVYVYGAVYRSIKNYFIVNEMAIKFLHLITIGKPKSIECVFRTRYGQQKPCEYQNI